MRTLGLILCFFLLANAAFSKKPKAGVYRGALVINEEKALEIPFNFELRYAGKKPTLIFMNGDERIEVDEIFLKHDSLNFKMPVYDTEFRTRFHDSVIEGVWINHYKTANNRMAFKAVFGEKRRFLFTQETTSPAFEGRWRTVFSPGSKDSSLAVGLFHHIEQTQFLTGTFLTETGDYRYLEGMQHGQELYLSSFDGSHAYLFVATLRDGKLEGQFYSGLSWSEPWIASPDANAQLRDAASISIVKDKHLPLQISFPDLDKVTRSLDDKKYAGKVVIVQVMGSWCPNCLDESRYFAELYEHYQSKGLEIIALAFERTDNFDKARQQLLRLKMRLGIDYDILVTQLNGKDKASAALPALSGVEAFPTTLFLNRRHKIVKVHTGFSGPATGAAYTEYKQQTEALLSSLLE